MFFSIYIERFRVPSSTFMVIKDIQFQFLMVWTA